MRTPVILAAGLASVMMFCQATTTRAALLSTLIDQNGVIIIGDKQFDHFGYQFTGDMPPASEVNVVGITDVFGNLGIRFQGAFHDNTDPVGVASDALFTYRVTVLDPLYHIVDAHITSNLDIIGVTTGAHISVTETFDTGGAPLSQHLTIIKDGVVQLTDAVSFLPNEYSFLNVQKDLLGDAGIGAVGQGAVTASFIDQTFSQIPEPMGLSMLPFALATLTIKRVRRTHHK